MRSAVLTLPALALVLFAACSDSGGAGDGVDTGGDAGVNEAGAPGDDAGTPIDPATIPACIEADGPAIPSSAVLEDGTGTVTVAVTGEGCGRSFAIASTAPRKDALPESPRTVAEGPDRPSLQTTNVLFDALYQLALDEAKELSVASIKDYAFRDGDSLACDPAGCFETGRKWNYVWTRDTAYAADLGLGWLDPSRARSSLDFKLSERRGGGDLQIVQDTGTGGSYPVSTDRVVWAIGAREVLLHLPAGAERDAFRDRALAAIVNTARHDREVVYDARDGLYRGEQSFLDWRDQTYPAWTVPDLSHIAQSKSLSTNVGHLAMFEIGAELADEKGEASTAADLRAKATALRTAIRTKLWLPADEQLSTYVTTELDPAPSRRADLLGTSLAVLHDVTTEAQARAAIASYPTLPKGPPVIFPQQRDAAIYHNRGIWPFVTAYWVRAARKVGNDGAFDAGVLSLMHGAALNLSNMENLEVVTGLPYFDDGPWSGPVVNSQRQLWSVAGYVGMVAGSLFGAVAEPKGLRVAPFVTRGLRRALFPETRSIVLNDLPFRGKKVSIVVNLPPPSVQTTGAYVVSEVRHNGVRTEGGFIDEAALTPRNLVEVSLAEREGAGVAVRKITDVTDDRALFAPRTPSITSVSLASGKVELGLDVAGEANRVSIDVYRDGVRVATNLPGTTTTWVDAATNGESTPSHCYTVDTRYAVFGNVSQRANPACFWGTGNPRITTLPASGFVVSGGNAVTAYGRFFYESWGDADHTIESTFTASRTGAHLLSVTYGNGAGGLTTGITCAVKKVTIEEVVGGAVAASGYVAMPQRADWASWGESTMMRASLVSGRQYRIRLSHDARAVNMSAFDHFASYTGGTGGTGGEFFRVNVAELKVLALVP